LVQLHQDAAGVRDSVDTLEEYNQDPLVIDWRADADTLDILRDQINQMDQILYRLQDIEKALPPEQQAEINAITPPMLELTDSTQAAIKFVNKYENRLWLPRYTAYADEMYSEVGRIERSTVTAGAKAPASTN
jgi:hypothetical protein